MLTDIALYCDVRISIFCHKGQRMKRIILLYNDYLEIYSRTETSAGELNEVFNSVEKIKESLENLGYDVVPVSIVKINMQLLDYINNNRDAIFFNLCESIDGDPEKEKTLPQFMEDRGIKFTGSGPKALDVCLNKFHVKKLFLKNKIPTPSAILIKSGSKLGQLSNLQFPLIIKPVHEDASIGISISSVVKNEKEASEVIKNTIRDFKQPVIAEEYIEGREITVSIWGNNPSTVIELSEIDFTGMPEKFPKIVTYNSKWDVNSQEYIGTTPICPAKINNSLRNLIEDLALKAYSATGCRDYARVDIRITRSEQPMVIDVNPNPDLSPEAGFFRAVSSKGLNYIEMVRKIVGFAEARNSQELISEFSRPLFNTSVLNPL